MSGGNGDATTGTAHVLDSLPHEITCAKGPYGANRNREFFVEICACRRSKLIKVWDTMRAIVRDADQATGTMNARIRELENAIAFAPCPNYESKGNGTCNDCECWKSKIQTNQNPTS
jgi:hypothetical protein